MHNLTLNLLPLFPISPGPISSSLASRVAGLNFPSPIGMAAGFDKDARRSKSIFRFGFGFVEVGTLTPRAQTGNPFPRIQRLEEDDAIVNSMGFPNCGLSEAVWRLARFKSRPGPLGINIGANADTSDKITDYVLAYRAAASVADYVTINVSSPNTPGLRTLESGSGLTSLLRRLDREIERLKTPLFLKVSPDLLPEEIQNSCAALINSKVSAVIVGNTSVRRPNDLKAPNVKSGGGLSGHPLRALSEEALENFYATLGGKLPIISVGGIASAEDAYRRICKGASLVQLYTGFIYEGPYLVKRMNRRLAELLLGDGHKSIASAVGSHVREVRAAKARRPAVGGIRTKIVSHVAA